MSSGQGEAVAGARRDRRSWRVSCLPERDKSRTGQEGANAAWTIFIQQLINGLTLGSIYGLIAIGYTMVFGIIGMVNFAHGDVFMLSAFIALIVFLSLTKSLGLGFLPLALRHRAGRRAWR